MNRVDGLSRSVFHLEGWNTIITCFVDTSQGLSSTRKSGSLIATALAITSHASARTIHREQFRFRLKFFDSHFKRVNRAETKKKKLKVSRTIFSINSYTQMVSAFHFLRAKNATATIGLLHRVSHLRFVFEKVAKLGICFTSQNLRAPSLAGLTNIHIVYEKKTTAVARFVRRTGTQVRLLFPVVFFSYLDSRDALCTHRWLDPFFRLA
jgi:hypothetical protein